MNVPSLRTEPAFFPPFPFVFPSTFAHPIGACCPAPVSAPVRSGSGCARTVSLERSHDMSPLADRKNQPIRLDLSVKPSAVMAEGRTSAGQPIPLIRQSLAALRPASPCVVVSARLREELLRVQEFDSGLFSPPRSHSRNHVSCCTWTHQPLSRRKKKPRCVNI